MPIYRIPLRDWVDAFVDYVTINFGVIFDAVNSVVEVILNSLAGFFLFLPWYITLALFFVIGWRIAGRNVAFFSVVGLFFVLNLNLWNETMNTLALVIAATLFSIALGIPLGIAAARSDAAEKILRPFLDLMQTMPSFVYLIPALLLFGLGRVPAVIATVVFSMPPSVRLTNLGIRQVPEDVVEAALSFGATPRQLLFDIQLPIAAKTIMAGINQTMLLALSMVVIAAMIGAGGLGRIVLNGITQVEVGLGFEGGISIVILAIILDRITQSVGKTEKEMV